MDTEDIKKSILDYILEKYNANYIGRISVTELDSGYKLSLGLANYMLPLEIIYDGTAEQFLDYIKKELSKRNFRRVQYSKAIRHDGQQRIYEVER